MEGKRIVCRHSGVALQELKQEGNIYQVTLSVEGFHSPTLVCFCVTLSLIAALLLLSIILLFFFFLQASVLKCERSSLNL